MFFVPHVENFATDGQISGAGRDIERTINTDWQSLGSERRWRRQRFFPYLLPSTVANKERNEKETE